jgi:hypothetical protein
MKITKAQLKRIIKEELSEFSEGNFEKANNDEEIIRTIVEKLHKMNSEQIMQSLEAIDQIYTTTTDFGTMQEGIENLTPENIQIVLQGLAQLALPAGLVAAASVALTNAVRGRPDAKQTKADLYAAAEEVGQNRL